MRTFKIFMITFKISFLVSVILIIACLPLLSNVGNTGTSNSSGVEIVASSVIVSTPIVINDDNDWIDLINSGRCTGQGTLNNPYVISNLKIDGVGSECILIALVQDVYYKIVNCNLYNGSYGVRTSYAEMGDIIGNNISYNTVGISTMPYSPFYCRNKVITGNIISHNTEEGVDAGYFYDVEISGNEITHNGGYGIYSLWSNERVRITNNNISFNGESGLLLVAYEQSEIQGNTIRQNGRGITLWSSSHNSITNNNISFNKGSSNSNTKNRAVHFLGGANNNTIENNFIIDNGLQEFYFDDSSNNTICDNTIVESSQLYYYLVGTSSGNVFTNNTIFYDKYEWNEVFEQAVELEQGYYGNLVAIDEDWYRIFLHQGDICEIFLDCSSAYEPLDLEIYNSSCHLLNYSDTGLFSRHASCNATSNDYYFFRIFNGINFIYSLQINILQKPDPPNPSDPSDPPEPIPPTPENLISGYNLAAFLVVFFIGLVSAIYFLKKKRFHR